MGWKGKENKPWFNPWLIILLHTKPHFVCQNIIQVFMVLGWITLAHTSLWSRRREKQFTSFDSGWVRRGSCFRLFSGINNISQKGYFFIVFILDFTVLPKIAQICDNIFLSSLGILGSNYKHTFYPICSCYFAQK